MNLTKHSLDTYGGNSNLMTFLPRFVVAPLQLQTAVMHLLEGIEMLKTRNWTETEIET